MPMTLRKVRSTAKRRLGLILQEKGKPVRHPGTPPEGALMWHYAILLPSARVSVDLS